MLNDGFLSLIETYIWEIRNGLADIINITIEHSCVGLTKITFEIYRKDSK